MGLGLVPAYRGACGRDGGHPVLLVRRREPCRRQPTNEHRLDSRRPAFLGSLDHLRPGHGEQGLAGVCRADGRQGRQGRLAYWGSGFLPASYQGTHFRKEGPPILDLQPPSNVTDAQQRSRLDLLREINRIHSDNWPAEDELDARIESYELAYRMQTSAPTAVELDKESEATKRLYGMDEEATRQFGTNCLLARRLVEHGVRFVEVYCGSGSGWDAHSKMEENHTKWCRVSDKPIAALLKDLKTRGLLEETLVVWGGEFGRTPFSDTNSLVSAPEQYGRDHNPWGFTIWMAGGGIRGGRTIGATDEIGFRAVGKPYHVHDIHATMLHMLGLNHLSVTYLHNGRAERPTHKRRRADGRGSFLTPTPWVSSTE